jgi:hypothetical protein
MVEKEKLEREPFLLRFQEYASEKNNNIPEGATERGEKSPQEDEPPKEPTSKGPWGD